MDRPRPPWNVAPVDLARLDDLPDCTDPDAVARWVWREAESRKFEAWNIHRHGNGIKPTVSELAAAVCAGVQAYHLDPMKDETRESLSYVLTMAGRTLMVRYGRPEKYPTG